MWKVFCTSSKSPGLLYKGSQDEKMVDGVEGAVDVR